MSRCIALVARQEMPEPRALLLLKQELLAHYLRGPEAYLALVIDQFLRFEASSSRTPFAAATRADPPIVR
jgi:hypothetical protein